MGKLIAGVAAAASVALGGPAAAEIRAVLVAVSVYTAPIPSLEGPPNDAAALKSLLEAQGARDIVVLQDAKDRKSVV